MQIEHTDFPDRALPSLYDIRHLPLKRACDILFSLSLLLLSSPLFFVIALLIKWSSPGSILYTHSRIGRGGKSFSCFKFRTMHEDSDMRLERLLNENPEARRSWGTRRKLERDPRVTPLGYWLRRTSLDELPQLWNVLLGDMSLVGPRPVTQEELTAHYGDKAAKILQLRPGMTGIWQISGRSNTCYFTRVMLDEQYIDHHSFLMDLSILLKTVPVVLSLRGAY